MATASRWGVSAVLLLRGGAARHGRGVRNVRDHFGGETFLIISGDALTDIDLTALWNGHIARPEASRRLSLKRVDDPSQSAS